VVEGLQKLLQRRSEWREMGLRGRQYVIDNLNWKKIGEKALSEYQKLLD
jgi:glycosyltransferase involved in cell wall biosynthesis